MNAKVKPYGDELIDFHDKDIPKVGSNHNCLAVMGLNAALNKDGSYYLQVFLKECI